MPQFACFLSISPLALAASITLAGAAGSPRKPQALTVSPASPDADPRPPSRLMPTAWPSAAQERPESMLLEPGFRKTPVPPLRI